MTEGQIQYHSQRAAEELLRAESAGAAEAGRRHRELADLHAEKARQSADAGANVVQLYSAAGGNEGSEPAPHHIAL